MGSWPRHVRRTDRSIRVDPQRVARQRELVLRRAAPLDERLRREAGQARHEPRVIGVQVLEHDALVRPEQLHLLIARPRHEVARVDVLRHRLIPRALLPRRRVTAELLGARWPARRDGAEARRLDELPRRREQHARRLQVRDGHVAERVLAALGRHADGVRRVEAAGRALVAERHLHEARALAQHAVVRPRALAEHLDRLVDLADDEPRDERPHRLLARRERVADEHHVGAWLERDEIARRVERARVVVVPVVVVLVRVLLLARERRLDGEDRVRRLRDDGERPASATRRPHERRGAERAQRNDVHPRSKLSCMASSKRSRVAGVARRGAIG